MAPKSKAKAPVPDYSALEAGDRLQAEVDGVFYAAEVVQVSDNKKRSKAPVKVHFPGYEATYDEWVGGDRLRSKKLKAATAAKESEAKAERKPREPMTFGYWKIRGLGAPCRMMLQYGGVSVTEKQYVFDPNDWHGKDKPELAEKNPLANLPYVVDGDTVVTQSNAVLLYIARKCRLMGPAKQRANVEMLLCDVYDMRDALVQLCYWYKGVCRTVPEYNEQSKKFIEEKGMPFYNKYEAWLKKNDTDFFCGPKPSCPDFHIWEMLDQYEALAKDVGSDSPLKDKPKVKAFYEKFKDLEKLKPYFESDNAKLTCNVDFLTFWSGAGSKIPDKAPK